MATLFLDIFFPLSERHQILPKVEALCPAAAPLGAPATARSTPLLSYFATEGSHSPTFEVLLQTLLLFFSWRDSYTVEKAISIGQRLLLHFAGRPDFSPFFGNTLLVAVLRGTLLDGYHQELHDAAIALVCLIFAMYRVDALSVLSPLPLPSLGSQASSPASSPVSPSPSLAAAPPLAAFAAAFDAEKDAKKRKAMMRQLLHPILGLKHSSLFQLDDSLAGIKSLPAKLIILQQQKAEPVWDWRADESPSGLTDFFNGS